MGGDERFFEDKVIQQEMLDLYHEKPGQFDDDQDDEVDLVSYAFQIWEDAIQKNPSLKEEIPALPPVIYSTKPFASDPNHPQGVLAFIRTPQGNETMAWGSEDKQIITQSPYAILQAAECQPETLPCARFPNHHDLVAKAVQYTLSTCNEPGIGQLGPQQGVRAKTYARLSLLAHNQQLEFFGLLPNEKQELEQAIDLIYQYPLCASATKILGNALHTKAPVQNFVDMVMALFQSHTLCQNKNSPEDEEPSPGPQIICSMGLRAKR